ncbi:phosphoglycerate dehydrogenase [Rhizobium sp. S153]|uniref:Phosphoglycerate dehydrogenase n=1 Tax=Ciceribacter sichuanensis TaxID=2949647 RepID=A0ABT0VE88_9HYPH|nr:NAD(P)-dependent oxidoreductase [Ciceribacter sp. S153]MCM2402790.1 phosphoglycerate dehydrogenase [Ciceribacter sp. S153]
MPTKTTNGANILICDLVGLKLLADGKPDHSEIARYVAEKGGVFHEGKMSAPAAVTDGRLHFHYLPDLSTREELLAVAGNSQYDAVIAAATFLPAETVFPLGGVRIGAGTGNMGSASWGGGSGAGGTAPLMNTPGTNSRATAQMVLKALLKVVPDLPVDELHALVAAGQFDTGRQLRDFPTEKLEGKRLAVIGYGNIGREVARLGHAFGMDVVVHARARYRQWIEAEGFIYAEDPVQAAAGADALSVHVGLGQPVAETGGWSNSGLIGDAVLSALNDGAVLINYDRGELVDVPALGRALASGKVRHAAIDADLFRNIETGALSGPMLPYLALVETHGDRLGLLPHAAADTDHPSRVAGAKQAVDQIFAAIIEKRVINLKGTLPEGYTDAGPQVPTGIGGLSASGLARFAGNEAALKSLEAAAREIADLSASLAKASTEGRLDEAATTTLEDLLRNTNTLSTLIRENGLQGPPARA